MTVELDLMVPVGVSIRHVHLRDEHLTALFGSQHKLSKAKDLSQPGQYASEERVDIIGPKGKIENVRILGPPRGNSQVEISSTDSFLLGVDPPVRDSGDLEGTPGITLQGTIGEITIDCGVIIAHRHIHMSPEDAKNMNLEDRQIVKVEVEGIRGLIFKNVLVRVSSKYRLDFHVDTDEANAAGIDNDRMVKILVD